MTAEAVGMLSQELYKKKPSELTEDEKSTVSAFASLAAGIAGGLVGGDTSSAANAAEAGKTTVENNALTGVMVKGLEKGYSACAKNASCLNGLAKLGVNFGLTNDQIENATQAAIAARQGDTTKLQTLSPQELAYIDEQIISGKGMAREMFGTQTWGDRIDIKPHTGGNQIPEQGRIDTGGNQIPEQGKTDTGGNQISEQGRTDTGGDQIPERIDNTHITPLPNQITVEDIAYLSENKDKIKDSWHKGSFDSSEESLQKHYEKHGREVGANDIEQYQRKAEEFAKSLKGAKTAKIRGATDNVTRYYKNGKYLDRTADGKIISFGKQ